MRLIHVADLFMAFPTQFDELESAEESAAFDVFQIRAHFLVF